MYKKILIISDYLDKNLGGIETYIYQIKDILSNYGFTTKLVGYKTYKSHFKRLLFLLLSFFNIFGYIKIKKEIKNFNPDIIRIHSVARIFGPIGILGIKQFKGKIIMMYHDLGYFTPFANEVENINQIPLPFNLKTRINSLKGKSLLKRIYGMLKFFKIMFLRKILINYVDVHLVPSEFMVDILIKWGIPKKKIFVLPHFVNEIGKVKL